MSRISGKPYFVYVLWSNFAARFYAATFPDGEVTAVHEAPADFPGGKKGDVLTVEFTVVGIPCLGLNGGLAFRHTEAFSFQIRDGESGRDGPLLECDCRQWRDGKPVRLVQGSMGHLMADHPARAHRCACAWWQRGQACLRGDDDDEEDRHRRHRGSAARLT